MAQIVVQHFKLDSLPQAEPRATEDAVYELPPQLTQGGFYQLAHLTEDEAVGWSLVAGQQQHGGLCGQVRRPLGTTRAQGTEGDSTGHGLNQGQGRSPILPIPWRQDDLEPPPRTRAQQLELKAKEPALAAFPQVRPLVPQQADPSGAKGLTERPRFAGEQGQAGGVRPVSPWGGQPLSDWREQERQAGHPVVVDRQGWKGRPPVRGDQARRLFEGGDLKDPLQQREGQHFGVPERGLGRRRTAPVRQARRRFQEIGHKTIDCGHLLLSAGTHRSSLLPGETTLSVQLRTEVNLAGNRASVSDLKFK